MKGAPGTPDSFDWDRLRIFRVVAETGSMSAAAQRLGGSLPTISRRMAELETDLQAELFRRSTRGVDLTDAGRLLLRHTDRIADAVIAARGEVTDMSARAGRRVHIVCGEVFAAYWIAPRLPEFERLNPGMTVTLTVCDDPDQLADLSPDIAIQARKPQQLDLICKRLGKSHHMLYAAPSYHRSQPRIPEFCDLPRTGCMVHSAYVEQMRGRPDAAREIALLREVNSVSTMIALCRAGLAPAILPTHLSDLAADLVPYTELPVTALDIWLCYSERMRVLNRGAEVLDWLRAMFEPSENRCFRETLTVLQSVPGDAGTPRQQAR